MSKAITEAITVRKRYEAEEGIRSWETHDLNLIAYIKLEHGVAPDAVIFTKNPSIPYLAMYNQETIGDKNDFATMVDCFYQNIFSEEPSRDDLIKSQLGFLEALIDGLA